MDRPFNAFCFQKDSIFEVSTVSNIRISTLLRCFVLWPVRKGEGGIHGKARHLPCFLKIPADSALTRSTIVKSSGTLTARLKSACLEILADTSAF